MEKCKEGAFHPDVFVSALTESKEAAAPATGDGETKPASSSPSPPVHSTPPLMEPRPIKAALAVENSQKNNSLPVQASSAPSEGIPPSFLDMCGTKVGPLKVCFMLPEFCPSSFHFVEFLQTLT